MKRIVLLLAFSALVQSGANATLISMSSVRLSEAEAKTLEDAACKNPHGVRMESALAYKYNGNSMIYADAKCAPHSSKGSRPIRFVARCNVQTSGWRCEGAQLEILANVAGKLADVRAINMTLESAADVVEWFGSGGWFERKSLKEIAQSGCYVSAGSNPDILNLDCGEWQSVVALNCAGGECRRVIVSLYQAIP